MQKQFGPYQIAESLGRGTEGEVFRAHHRFLRRDVALKIVNLAGADPIINARVQREMYIVTTLQHRNLVSVVDAGIKGQRAYVAMELVEGGSLSQRLRDGAVMPWQEAVRLSAQLVAALVHLHAAGVIHRDVKPANILMGADGVLKLADFGLAHCRSNTMLTFTGALIGTPLYMPPEAWSAQPPTPAWDAWSVGCILYLMLTGRTPFQLERPNLIALSQRICNWDPESPRTLTPSVPPELDSIILGLLAKAPQLRPALPDVVLPYLRRSIRRQPISARDAVRVVPTSAAVPPVAAPPAAVPPVAAPPAAVPPVAAPPAAVPVQVAAVPTPTSPTATPAHVRILSEDGSEMMLIPAGEFLMGDKASIEVPQHKVFLDEFYMDKYLVTNRQYRKFVLSTNRRHPGMWKIQELSRDDQPVVGATWNDAAAYSRWVKKRLPTEAEWEKAARGGLEGRTYPWGDREPKGLACFGRTWIGGFPSPVGEFTANRYGLFDMAGDAWQWCADWYDADYYHTSPYRNPPGAATGTTRVIRGGSWFSDSVSLHCSNRSRYNPLERFADIGFRCALSRQ